MIQFGNFVSFYFIISKRQKALNVTGDKGVEPAMEWLLAHSDDSEVAPPQAASNVLGVSGANDDAGAAGGSASASALCSSTSEPIPEAKSFKCEEWYFELFYIYCNCFVI